MAPVPWLSVGLLVMLVAGAPAAGAAAAPPATCVVGQIDILQRSRPALNGGLQLQQARQKAQGDYDVAARDIDAEARVLDGLKGALPAPVAQARLRDIADRRLALQRKAAAINSGLADFNARLGATVMQQAAPVIRDIAQARGCGIVLPREASLQVVDSSLDLTDAVLQRLAALPAAANATR